MPQVNYSVLTYIFNGDEYLRDVPKEDSVEYVCVTDNPKLQHKDWKVIVDEDLAGLDPLYASFYVRYHPFKYCKGNVCIRIDGSIKIKESLLPIFEEFDSSGYDVCVMTNSRATSIEKELFFWMGSPYSEVKKTQRELYKNLGVDTYSQGCIQSPISITRNTDICNFCDRVCWDFIDKLSTKDRTMRPSQVAMTVALHLTEGLKIMFVDESLIQSNVMQWCKHGSEAYRRSMCNVTHDSFFGKPIKTHQFNGVHSINDKFQYATETRKYSFNPVDIKKFLTSRQNMCSNK